MKITIQTEITQHHTCNACDMDEEAPEGVQCSCFDEDVWLEVVAEVGLDESKSDHPFGQLSVAACIDILSIKDLGRPNSRGQWSPMQVELLDARDALAIKDALWLAYLETQPKMVLNRKTAELCDTMKTYVAWAIDSGTHPDHVNAMLEGVKDALLSASQQKQEGVVLS